MKSEDYSYEYLKGLLGICLILIIFRNPWGLYFMLLGFVFYGTMVGIKSLKKIVFNLIILVVLSGIFYVLFKELLHLIDSYLKDSKDIYRAKSLLKTYFHWNFLNYKIFYFLLGFVGAFFLKPKFFNTIFERLFSIYQRFFSKSVDSQDIVIGTDQNGKKFTFSDENLFLHTQIIGAPGSGKTNIIKHILSDRIKKNKAVIFIDYKGESETLNWITKCLESFERRNDLRLLSISGSHKSINYNPISGGSAAQIASRIMSSLTWSESFYKDYSENALKEMLHIVSKSRDYEISVVDIKNILSSRAFFDDLNSRHKFILHKEEKEVLYKKIYSAEGRRNTLGLLCQLENLCLSPVAKNLQQNTDEGLLDFIRNKRFIYFQMNSMLDASTSSLLGKLLLSDLIFQVGREFDLSHSPALECLLCIDEFSAFATPEFLNLLDRARGAGMAIMVSHQNSADTEKISPEYAKSIESNTSNKIIFGTSLHDEAEKFSRYLGTKKSKKETFQTIKDSLFRGHVLGERGSIRESEEFVVHPNKIKNLRQGEALVIKRFINPSHGIVRLPKAPIFS